MLGDIDNKIHEELAKIRSLLEEQTGQKAGSNVQSDVGVTGGSQNVGVQVETAGGVGDSGPLTDNSPMFTTGPGGATVSNENFTNEGEFAFGFPSRIVYVRTEDAPVILEFDGTNTPTRQIPVPASKGEVTLGDGGAGFRAEEVNVKLARNASVNETTVHIIAYR